MKHNISYNTKRRTCIKITRSLFISQPFCLHFSNPSCSHKGRIQLLHVAKEPTWHPGPAAPAPHVAPQATSSHSTLEEVWISKRSQDENRKCSRNVIWQKCVHLAILINKPISYHCLYIYTAHPQKIGSKNHWSVTQLSTKKHHVCRMWHYVR